MTQITSGPLLQRNAPFFTLFAVSFLFLITSWIILFWWMTLFTEAFLVPWYCCGVEALPSLGTWQRTINDFFAGSPGRYLPSIGLITVNAYLLVVRLARARTKAWIPIVFFLANILLLAGDIFVTNISWMLSNWIVGSRVGGIDAGFHRTWYGIAFHLVFWAMFFAFLARANFRKPRRIFRNLGSVYTEAS